MAQRGGIARALALRSRLVLMDEPSSAVDAFTRFRLQQELMALLKRYRPTMMFVTHVSRDMDHA
jgi:NitT/TauT family transport system ATP-binding protein